MLLISTGFSFICKKKFTTVGLKQIVVENKNTSCQI